MKRGDITSWRRDGDVLRPNSARARAMLATVEDCERVPVQFLHPRDKVQLKAYHAILRRVFMATGDWKSVDDLSFTISKELKAGAVVIDPDGTVRWQPDSRAVSSMTQERFTELYRDTVAWLIARYDCHPNDLKVDAA